MLPVAGTTIQPVFDRRTGVIVLARIVALGAYRELCDRTLMEKPLTVGLSHPLGREVIRFGGWVTVSKAVGPLMMYFDRFLIGSLLTMTAVAYYTVPYELVTKLWVLVDGLLRLRSRCCLE